MRRSRWYARVALDQAGLHLDRAPNRVHYAAELNDAAVASALDDAAVMGGDGGIDEIAMEAPQARQGAILVRRGESAVTDNVGDQDRSELARFPHGASPGRHSGYHESQPIAVFIRASMHAGLDSGQQRLRLSDLGHLRTRREAFQRGGENGVGVGSAAGRLIELGEGKRREQPIASRPLLFCDGDGGPVGVFGARGIVGIKLEQDIAPDTMQEGKVAMRFALMGEGQRVVDAREPAVRTQGLRLELRQ